MKRSKFSKEAGERGRFDTAHELGHLVLHRHRGDLQTVEAEREADRFASSFLLPTAQFTREAAISYMVSDYLRLKPLHQPPPPTVPDAPTALQKKVKR